ncbi:hypothetical protein SDJN03_07040, partial [Cucurbita argyrosperma subsp. sororia]
MSGQPMSGRTKPNKPHGGQAQLSRSMQLIVRTYDLMARVGCACGSKAGQLALICSVASSRLGCPPLSETILLQPELFGSTRSVW